MKRRLPKLLEVEGVKNKLRFSQSVVVWILSCEVDTLGHLCRVTAGSLALDPHLKVHGHLHSALRPIVYRLGDIKALPAGFVNGNQPEEVMVLTISMHVP